MNDTKISRAVGMIAPGVALLTATAGVGAQQTASEAVPTFAKDVAPLFYRTCVSCHRPGEMGPMSLVTYQSARPWARSIRDRVVARSMPPWFADPHYGTFSNDPTLSQKDIDTIVAWVAGGAPHGDLRKMPKLPETRVAVWQIGTPDVVFEMPEEFQIPPTGTISYKTYNVKTTFKDDLWVVAAEVRPEDRAHVHHAVVTVIEPGGNKPLGAVEVTPLAQETQKDSHLTPEELEKRLKTERGRSASTEHRLAGYAVGEGPRMIPAGYAKRIPAGSTSAFDALYDQRNARKGSHQDWPGTSRRSRRRQRCTWVSSITDYSKSRRAIRTPRSNPKACFSRTSTCGRFIRICTCAGKT